MHTYMQTYEALSACHAGVKLAYGELACVGNLLSRRLQTGYMHAYMLTRVALSAWRALDRLETL